jgi:hypothetical protein
LDVAKRHNPTGRAVDLESPYAAPTPAADDDGDDGDEDDEAMLARALALSMPTEFKFPTELFFLCHRLMHSGVMVAVQVGDLFICFYLFICLFVHPLHLPLICVKVSLEMSLICVTFPSRCLHVGCLNMLYHCTAASRLSSAAV